MEIADRLLAPILRRIDMMVARGVLRGTNDEAGVQTMQVSLLEGETADDVERFQTYGLSAVPPSGGDALVLFVQGNRDHGVVVAINDRGSRPRGLNAGEVCLYNNADVTITLAEGGELRIDSENEITIKTKKLKIEADDIEIDGDVALEGDLACSGTITADTVNAPNGSVGG